MSLQLDRYLHLRALDTPVEAAAEQSGLGIEEARAVGSRTSRAGRWSCLVYARVQAHARAEQSEEANMEDVTTTHPRR
jgi:hypothetical protein